MTNLLQQAIAKAKRLPTWEQDALAAMILEEIEDNQDWKQTQDELKDQILADLIDEALSESA